MMQPPFEQAMQMPGAGAPSQPMASPQAMNASGQATRKVTREVPREELNNALRTGAEAVAQALYKSPKVSKGAIRMISPDEDKIGSTAKSVTMLLSEVNKRAQIPERVMVPLTILTADEMMDMAEEAGRATFNEQEAQQVMFTAAEMILQAHGVPPERAAQLAQQASQQELKQAESVFNKALGEQQSGQQQGDQQRA